MLQLRNCRWREFLSWLLVSPNIGLDQSGKSRFQVTAVIFPTVSM